MIKKHYLYGFLMIIMSLMTACTQYNQTESLKFNLLSDELIPILDDRAPILSHLEGNLSTEIVEDHQEQSDYLPEEHPVPEEVVPSPNINELESDENLPPATSHQTGVFMDQMEQEVISLVNQLRQELGVPPLELSKELRLTARSKSKDMFEYQYFDHQGHVTFSHLLEKSQIKVTITGENIYRSQSPLTTAKLIFDTWKSSPTHYDNMINEQFHYIGVGIYNVNEEGINTYFATQHLTD